MKHEPTPVELDDTALEASLRVTLASMQDRRAAAYDGVRGELPPGQPAEVEATFARARSAALRIAEPYAARVAPTEDVLRTWFAEEKQRQAAIARDLRRLDELATEQSVGEPAESVYRTAIPFDALPHVSALVWVEAQVVSGRESSISRLIGSEVQRARGRRGGNPGRRQIRCGIERALTEGGLTKSADEVFAQLRRDFEDEFRREHPTASQDEVVTAVQGWEEREHRGFSQLVSRERKRLRRAAPEMTVAD